MIANPILCGLKKRAGVVVWGALVEDAGVEASLIRFIMYMRLAFELDVQHVGLQLLGD
jgi:hypothetical protein